MADWQSKIMRAGMALQGKLPEYDEMEFLKDERRANAMVQDFSVAHELATSGDFEGADRFLESREGYIKQLGGDSYHTSGVRERLRDPSRREEIIKELEPFRIRYQMMQSAQGGGKGYQFGAQETFADTTGNLFMGTMVNNPQTGQSTPSVVAVDGSGAQPQGNLRLVNNVGLTAGQIPDQAGAVTAAQQNSIAAYAALIEQLRQQGQNMGAMGGNGAPSTADLAALETGAKEDAKAESARAQDSITLGIDAAKSIPIFKRASGLLNTVETGGLDKVKVDAKKWFGIESADEAEFGNLLGKQVIAQIKPIFGAAPTAKEGEWLRAMESGWGTSTAGNKRLLENGLRLAERRAETGQQRALERKDKGSFDEIESYRKFTFDGSDGDNEDAQAIAWAKANPNDPRAAAILQKAGAR